MKRERAIGVLDLGASGGRVFAATCERDRLRLVEVYRFEHRPQSYVQKDALTGKLARRSCWDFGRLWQGLCEGLRRLASREALELRSFGIDTWGSDGAWTSAAGDMLGMIGTGRDTRWRQAQEELLGTVGRERLFQETGVQSHPFNVINQLFWYRHHEPRLVEAAATYLPINSLLNYLLTGRRVAEHTWMSTTQLCPAGEACYHESLFEELDLPLEKMPPIVTPGTNLGPCLPDVARQIGAGEFDVVVPATHDTACAFATAGTQRCNNTMIVSTGTWFLAGVVRPRPLLDNTAFRAGLSNEAAADGNTRLLKNIMGTWPAQELRRLWSRQDGTEISWAGFDNLAATATACPSILDVDSPMFSGPENMEEAIARFCAETGQIPPGSREEAARAVYEGLVIKVAQTAELLARATQSPVEEILLLGGAVRSALLSQWIADASGLPVRIGPADATALGNALVQAQALGWLPSPGRCATVFEPLPCRQIFQPAGDRDWDRISQRLREICNNINPSKRPTI